MYVIGLTGGIASGKSTVGNYLVQKSIPFIDCDQLAREAVALGKQALTEIEQLFGKQVLYEDGTLNRNYLGEIVFNDPQKRLQLEGIVHKQVLHEVKQLLSEYNAKSEPVVVIDIPLLYEVGWQYLTDEVWVVACSYKQQLARLQQRNNLTIAEAEKRINSQMPLAHKIKKAHIVLDNSGSKENLFQQIEERLQHIRKMRE